MKRLAVWSLPILAICLLSTGVVGATSIHNPAGNNGTIKIDDEVVADNTPENNPHVSCMFSVQLYNYDQNNSQATVNFALQAPTDKAGDSLSVTAGNLHPSIGGHSDGSGTTMDASEQYTLGFTGTPQPNQGYHVKVTVTAPGSQGNDTKQKVFWVQPCTPSAAATTTENSHVLGAQTSQPGELPNTGSTAGEALLLGGTATVSGYGLTLWRRLRATRG
jgi:LPXTG-motif cell wall-anchored protein